MLYRSFVLVCLVSTVLSFQQPSVVSSRSSQSSLFATKADKKAAAAAVEKKSAPKGLRDRVVKLFTKEAVIPASAEEEVKKTKTPFDDIVMETFPGALTNQQLLSRVFEVLDKEGCNRKNTLLATSLCCDELARRLEDDFVKVYGNNFNLGGLAGFPFAGNTGFGAMSAHIPDGGFCLVIYGPHVGITQDGLVGKVERSGIELVDTCCGSAVAASNYLQGITDGGAQITTNIKSFTDFQQNVVQELILPHGQRLSSAENRMKELPYALYQSQDIMLREIVSGGSQGVKKGIALLGGIQINTGPTSPDYFHPLRFDYMNNKGEVVQDFLPDITKD